MIKKAKKIKILIYPRHKNHGVENPYQKLIYEKMINNKNYEIKFVNYLLLGRPSLGALIFPFKLIYFRLIGFNILHIQFLYPFFPLLKNKFVKKVYYYNLLYNLKIVNLIGLKLILTLHEVMPHDPQFLDDIAATRLITNQTKAIIIHSKNTIKEMERLRYNTKNIHITTHGNFIGVYANNVSKEEARKYFKLNNKDFVILLFGILSPYKGIYKLINSAYEILKDKRNIKIRFIIAGKTTNKDVINKLNQLKGKYPSSIILKVGYIEENNIQYYYNAADIVTCPFIHVNTSGTAILAFSYKKPLIYSRIGDFKDFPKNVGISYELDNSNGLTESLKKVIYNKKTIKEMSNNAYIYVKQLSWKRIAEDTLNIYKEVYYK